MLKYQMIGLLIVSLCIQSGLEAWGSLPYIIEQVRSAEHPVHDVLIHIDQPLRRYIIQQVGNHPVPANVTEEVIRSSEYFQLQRLLAMPGTLIENAVRCDYAQALASILQLLEGISQRSCNDAPRDASSLISQGLILERNALPASLLHTAIGLGHSETAAVLSRSVLSQTQTRRYTDF